MPIRLEAMRPECDRASCPDGVFWRVELIERIAREKRLKAYQDAKKD